MEKLIQLPKRGKVVLVGDTHGDFQAAKLVTKSYLRKNNYVVFLGDYVDRGPASAENIDYLLELRTRHPNLILLAGNHEMFPLVECSPADFWKSLPQETEEGRSRFSHYRDAFSELPLAVAGKGFLALHGALPEIQELEEINKIDPGDDNWMKILWGDFRDKPGEYLGDFLGRPKFGRDYFQRIMDNIGRNVLVRGHDPAAPERMFDNRCLTIFTSAAYGRDRKIALANLARRVTNADDFELISF